MKLQLMLLLVGFCAAGCVTTDRTKSVAIRAFTEILGKGRYELVPDLYAPDFRNHGLTSDETLAADMSALRALRDAAPADMQVRPQQLISEGEFVSVLWVAEGTFGTGRRAFRGITIWRIVDGRIHDEWSEFDEAGLKMALGLQAAH